MKVLILPDAAAAVATAADHVEAALARLPAAVLGLATGGTMEPLHAALAARHREGRLSFARARSFNLDEYVGLGADDPRSYHATMRDQLFSLVDFAPGATRLPDGAAPDPHAEALAYEAAIAAAGGIDFQLLGLGRNGHIGFNEPTSSLGSRTRVKTLAASTREANARFFGQGKAPPTHAITMGLGTILAAREVLLLATGEAKAEAVRAMVEGPLAAVVPASVLQLHPRATVVLDAAAASRLALGDYYHLVHPGGGPAAV